MLTAISAARILLKPGTTLTGRHRIAERPGPNRRGNFDAIKGFWFSLWQSMTMLAVMFDRR